MNRVKELITNDLKAAGYNAKQVSVKKRPGGLETSLKITIRDPNVSYSVVEQLKVKHTSISRDEHTFDILGGGNTFIELKLSEEVTIAWASVYQSNIETVMDHLIAGGPSLNLDQRFSISSVRPFGYEVNDHYAGHRLNTYFSNATDMAVALYILRTKLLEKLPQEFVFRHWCLRLWRDKDAFRNQQGSWDRPAMARDAATQFGCATEEGNSPREQEIAQWIEDFFGTYPAFLR